LRDPRPGVRIAVLQALARMRRSEASRWVQVALEDEVADVRLAALTELRRLGTRGVDRRLVTIARSDPDAVVRRAALGALQGASATRDSGSLSPGDPASSRGQ
jgi:hypothetical protein